jgi:hypothetical protein
MMKRGTKVKWPSVHNENYVFKGVVRRVVGDRAIIDDGSGRTYRVVPTRLLVENRT